VTKITAEQARDLALSQLTTQELLDAVYLTVEKAAKEKRRSIRLNDKFWVYEGYNSTKEWKEAVELLKKDGYKVRFVYEERQQFVDMYTLVEW